MLEIVTAEQRMKKRTKTNTCLIGAAGAGKTTQARTLSPLDTLFIDLEAGTLALEGSEDDTSNPPWGGDIIKVRDMAVKFNVHPWVMLKAITCLITGADPLVSDPNNAYSAASYAGYCSAVADPKTFEKYNMLFIDSLTVGARWCFKWCQTQPQAFSEKTGKPDNRGAYGLLGQEMITWLTNLQHCEKSLVAAAILDEKKDDFGRKVFEIQIEGSKTGLELPGIFDELITLADFETETGQKYRAFVCQKQNPYGYPAKDRSGRLNVLEEPHLGKLIKKMRDGQRLDTQIITSMPEPVVTA